MFLLCEVFVVCVNELNYVKFDDVVWVRKCVDE